MPASNLLPVEMSHKQLHRLRPTYDRVLIKCDPLELRERKVGLLYQPGRNRQDECDHQEFYRTGTVIKIGDGDKRRDGSRIPMTVTPGDRVVYDHSSAHEINCDGETYCLIPEAQWVVTVFGQSEAA